MKNAKYSHITVSILSFLGQKTVMNSSTADTIYYGGNIITMEGDGEQYAEAVAVKDDKILFVGSKKEAMKMKGDSTVLIDLHGKTMMPGFIEQHLHPFLGALTLSIPVIAPEDWKLPSKTWPSAKDQVDYITKLKAVEASMKSAVETLFCWGYHPLFHGKLNRQILDDVSLNRPICIWHRSGHEFILNSMMVKRLGLNQAEIDQAGEEVAAQSDLNEGHFYENGALLYLLPRIMPELGSIARFKAGLKQMVEILHANGVTAYNEPGAIVQPEHVKLYKEILGAGSTPMYSFFIPESKTPYYLHAKEGSARVMEAVKEMTDTFPREGKIRFFDKHIKILLDGAIISQLMQMKDGYLDGHEGQWIQTPEEANKIFDIFWKEGYQIHIHVNGDLGMEKLLEIIEKHMAEYPREDHRTTIVHFANSTDEQVQKLARLGCIVSANPYYVTGFSDKFAEVGLGPERANSMVRLGPVEKLGVRVSVHSDLPMAPSDPLFLAWCAATRTTNNGNTLRQDLALSLHGALKAITIDAAQSWRMENELGSIKAGKKANFTIIDQNPYKVGARGLKDIKVIGTVFEGKYYPVKRELATIEI
jgi:predicted amidohydrolase YtcJ